MTDTNFISSIVKILETPKHQINNRNIITNSFRAQFPQARDTSIVHLNLWGNLARDVSTYYKINDYILIEGYIALKVKPPTTSNIQMTKEIEITVIKIYPFLLSYSQ